MPDAFQESSQETTAVRSAKSLKLALNTDGSIDWESSLEKHKEAFIRAIEVDPNGILQNIQEQAGETPSTNPTGIADSTVLGFVNLIMVGEAILYSTVGAKLATPLKFVHPVVAIKACAVSMKDIEPIMEPGKRIIKRYVPDKYLTQEFQDIAVCAEELAKLSIAKFKACVELGVEIQHRLMSPNNQSTNEAPPNGHAPESSVN